MAGSGRVYNSSGGASSSLSVLLQNQRGSEPLDSLFLSGSSNASSTSPFLGTLSLLCLINLSFIELCICSTPCCVSSVVVYWINWDVI